mgnify:CR=1 FL=1
MQVVINRRLIVNILPNQHHEIILQKLCWDMFCNLLIIRVSYTDLACHNSDYKKSKKL